MGLYTNLELGRHRASTHLVYDVSMAKFHGNYVLYRLYRRHAETWKMLTDNTLRPPKKYLTHL